MRKTIEKEFEFIEALVNAGFPKYLCESINSVRKAVFENGTRWIYFGVFLDDESRERLLSKFDIPEGWREYADHMTIVFNNKSEEAEKFAEMCMASLGEPVTLTVTHVGITDKTLAVRVTGCKSNNKTPHITVSVSPIGKPVDSNNITNWEKIDEFTVSGTVEMR